MEDRKVIEQNQSNMIKLLFWGFILVLASVYCINSHGGLGGLGGVIRRTIGILGLVLFGIYIIYVIYRIANPKEVVILEKDSFTDNSSLFNAGTIRWEDVVQIYSEKKLGGNYICIVLKNTKEFIRRLPFWKRISMGSNKMFHMPLITISLEFSEESCESVVDMMQGYLDRYQAEVKM